MHPDSNSLWNKFVQLLKPKKTVQIEEILRSLQLSAIGIRFQPGGSKSIKTGDSKFGGKPDVPEDFQWPVDDQRRPLSLLFQINCAELTAWDTEKVLPPYGRLYFFYELSQQDWEGLGKSVRVLYCDAVKAELQAADFPEELPDAYRLPERALLFTPQKSYPSIDDLSAAEVDTDYIWEHSEEYDEIRERLLMEGTETDACHDCSGSGCSECNDADTCDGDNCDACHSCDTCNCDTCDKGKETPSEIIGSMLGYADLIQNNIVEKVRDYVLLLQLPSIETGDENELMFGDCGSIYFYISRQDLKENRFDRIKFELQCY